MSPGSLYPRLMGYNHLLVVNVNSWIGYAKEKHAERNGIEKGVGRDGESRRRG